MAARCSESNGGTWRLQKTIPCPVRIRTRRLLFPPRLTNSVLDNNGGPRIPQGSASFQPKTLTNLPDRVYGKRKSRAQERGRRFRLFVFKPGAREVYLCFDADTSMLYALAGDWHVRRLDHEHDHAS